MNNKKNPEKQKKKKPQKLGKYLFNNLIITQICSWNKKKISSINVTNSRSGLKIILMNKT